MNITPLKLVMALWLALALVLLAGCEAMPFSVTGGAAAQQATAGTAQQAQELESVGDFQRAAAVWEQLASVTAAPQREAYRLDAAHDWLRAGQPQRARVLLQQIDSKGLAAALWVRRQLIEARIALAENDATAALGALLEVTAPAEAQPLQIEIHVLRAEAHNRLQQHLAAARERVALEPMLSDTLQRRDNQRAIVASLADAPDAELAAVSRHTGDVVGGWAELVRIARSTVQGDALKQKVTAWRARNRNHPVTEETLASLRTLVPYDALASAPLPGLATDPAASFSAQTSSGANLPLALMLPLTGPLAAAGNAVREGFMAAANAQGAGTSVRVYDVGVGGDADISLEVLSVYQQASQEGAAFAVGPLAKDGVKALYNLGALPVPTLALNYNEDSTATPHNLYEFGLAPEDEARQAAERAWLDGRSRVLVLTPEGEWGDRILRAFREHLERLGGLVVAQQTYQPEGQDFSGTIRKLLGYRPAPASGKRAKPTRRQDADAIFMVALPSQARIIHPQLRYYYAFDLPVYSTSHLYSGKPDPVADLDLDGILFSDMPWVLTDTPRKALSDALPAQHGESLKALRGLYALGVDAYRVIGHLPRLQGTAAERFEGETGSLRLDGARRIHRQPIWARFENGIPRLIDTGAGPAR